MGALPHSGSLQLALAACSAVRRSGKAQSTASGIICVVPNCSCPENKMPLRNLRRLALASFVLCCASLLCSRSGASAVLPDEQKTLQEIGTGIANDRTRSQAIEKLQSLLERDPNNCAGRILLGVSYESLGLPDQAEIEYQKAAKYLPNSRPEAIALIRAEVHAGRMHAAGELLAAARKRYPNDSQLNFWQGNFFASQQDMEQAEHAYFNAMRENAKILGLSSALSEIRISQERYPEAALLAQTDINNDAKFWPAYKMRGIAALKMGNFKEAAKALTLAFEHLPYSAGAAGPLAEAANKIGNNELALKAALVDLAISSRQPDLFARAQDRTVQIWKTLTPQEAEAIVEETESTRDFPQNLEYHVALGEILDELGRHAIAVTEYQRALRVKPRASRALFLMGRDLEQHYHDYDDAMKNYAEAHQIDPADQEITNNLNRLQQRMKLRATDFSWQLKDILHHSQ